MLPCGKYCAALQHTGLGCMSRKCQRDYRANPRQEIYVIEQCLRRNRSPPNLSSRDNVETITVLVITKLTKFAVALRCGCVAVSVN